MKTQVRHLKAGDNLGNCVIAQGPVYIGNYLGSKDRARVRVRYPNGEESTRIWGWRTTVVVKEK